MTIPTPILGLIMALATLAAIVLLLVTHNAVPDALYYVETASVGAFLGGSVPSVNIGKPTT